MVCLICCACTAAEEVWTAAPCLPEAAHWQLLCDDVCCRRLAAVALTESCATPCCLAVMCCAVPCMLCRSCWTHRTSGIQHSSMHIVSSQRRWISTASKCASRQRSTHLPAEAQQQQQQQVVVSAAEDRRTLRSIGSEGTFTGGCFVTGWLQFGVGVGPGHATALGVFFCWSCQCQGMCTLVSACLSAEDVQVPGAAWLSSVICNMQCL
jgi:hypothetical protein